MAPSKFLLALVAVSLLATSASASMMLEKFENFVADPTSDNLIILVAYQLWGFFGPFLAGVLEVILLYLWEEGSYDVETDG